MAKAFIHAKSSARRWGGKPEDYQKIHDFLDCTKSVVANNTHRCILHNSWSIYHIIPAIFGDTFVNSDGRTVSSKDVAEQHCLEDFGGVIPTLQDWLQEIPLQPWMSGIGRPPSAQKIPEGSKIDIRFD